jgi:hypothetical protein
MQIGRFGVGLWRNKKKKIVWTPLFEITQIGKKHENCGCHILTFGPICVEWLGDECLSAGRTKPRRAPSRRR